MRPLVIISGPTAAGKTGLSITLSEEIDGEIISADSMQVYKYMNIGTAKIMPEEMKGIKHYLIDEFEPDDEFNVTVFKEKAKKYINEISLRDKTPIIVGGTGFYIQAVLYDIDFTEYNDDNSFIGPNNSRYREELQKILQLQGKEYLYNMLNDIDPEYARIIHMNNSKKVIRALEFFHMTGKKLSVHNSEQESKKSPYNYIYFVIDDDRELIYNRINKRVDDMITSGLVDEVKRLLDMGYNRNLTSMQGIGYKEIVEYLDKKCSLQDAVEKIKKGTRHYARRQSTWFRREKDTVYIKKQDFKDNREIIMYMKERIIEIEKNV